MTKLSIIIPIYNAGKYLEKTLESVVNQTFNDFEVLCINDCSTDNSLEVLEKFAQKNNKIKILNNEINLGSAKTRNTGIEKAEGEYIYFLDNDDYIDKKYLECMVNKIEKENCDIIMNLSIINELNGNRAKYKHPSMPEINKNGEYLDNITVIHDAPCFIWARMYKKSFLDKNNLRFLDTVIDDVIFNTISSLCTEKTFIFYGENYHYTVTDNGVMETTSKHGEKDLLHIKAYLMIYEYLKERNKLDNRLKLFRVYPFMKVDTEEKFDFYKHFFEVINSDFYKNECIYNEMEKYFAYSIINSVNLAEYLTNYNKIVTIGFLRKGFKKQ